MTSQPSFFAATLLDLGLLVSIGVLTYPLTQDDIGFLNSTQAIAVWVVIALLYAVQFYKAWQVNQDVVGSLNPLSPKFLKATNLYLPSQRYQVKQIALLDLTYWVNLAMDAKQEPSA